MQLQNKDGSEEEEEQSEDPAWNGAWDVYLDLVSTQQIYKFVPFELALRRILSKDKNLAFVILQECVLKESTFFLGVAFGNNTIHLGRGPLWMQPNRAPHLFLALPPLRLRAMVLWLRQCRHCGCVL